MESPIDDQTRKDNSYICERENRRTTGIIQERQQENNIQHKEKKENKKGSGIRDIYHYLT